MEKERIKPYDPEAEYEEYQQEMQIQFQKDLEEANA
jgi:hypothetical protein